MVHKKNGGRAAGQESEGKGRRGRKAVVNRKRSVWSYGAQNLLRQQLRVNLCVWMVHICLLCLCYWERVHIAILWWGGTTTYWRHSKSQESWAAVCPGSFNMLVFSLLFPPLHIDLVWPGSEVDQTAASYLHQRVSISSKLTKKLPPSTSAADRCDICWSLMKMYCISNI